MDVSKIYGDRTSFQVDGKEYYLVDLFASKNHLFVMQARRGGSDVIANYTRMSISKVPVETLKEIEIWDRLDKATQTKLIEHEAMYPSHAHERMAKARGSRKEKYLNIPRELQCTTCDAKIPTPPGTTAKKVEKLGILLDDYLKKFQCRVCKPVKRGRPRKK